MWDAEGPEREDLQAVWQEYEHQDTCRGRCARQKEEGDGRCGKGGGGSGESLPKIHMLAVASSKLKCSCCCQASSARTGEYSGGRVYVFEALPAGLVMSEELILVTSL